MNPQNTTARPSVDLEATDEFPILDATAYEAEVLARESAGPSDRPVTATEPDPPAAASQAPDQGAPDATPRMADSDDMAAVENWIAQKTEELRAYHEALTVVQRERAAALARADALTRELSETNTALEAAKGRERSLAETLNSEQEAARQRAAEIAQRETRARERLAAEIKALQAQVANCLESLQSRESYRAIYESGLQELEAELAAARLRATEREARANQLGTELQASDQQLQIAVRERDALRHLHDTENTRHATERGEGEHKRGTLESTIAQLTAEHADKCAQLLALEATLSAAQQRAEAEALANGTAAERLRELESAHAARQAELTQARLEIERNRALLADLTAALLKSQTMFSDQGRLLEEREAAASTMAASQAERGALITTLRGRIEELTAQRVIPEAERRALEERVAALAKGAAESETRIFRLESVNSELRATLGRANTSLAEREAELQRATQMASINAYALERVQSSIDDIGRTLTASEGVAPQAQVGILTRVDNGQNHSVVLRGRTTIGRDRDNDLPLAMRSVSRHHAVLIPAFRTAFVQDLRSTNGVLVNRRRVRCARLEHGDVITCGEAQFRYTVTPAPGGAFRASAPSPAR